MRMPEVVAFRVAFIWKLKNLFRLSEEYLEPDRISTMNFWSLTIFA